MLKLNLKTIADITAGTVIADDPQAVSVTGVGIDTRTLQPDMLFAAFRGERVDGHEYLSAARAAGAAAALVERSIDGGLPQVVVADTETALQQLAAHWRQRFDLPVIGITGSNGKTTVKEMLAGILAAAGIRAMVTSGNRNNELGLPLMLLELAGHHQVAVLEMGAGQPGDIRLLAQLARPQMGVITHIGPAHLERLGSLAGVARAKSELFEQLPEDGLAIMPLQVLHASILRGAAGCPVHTFGALEDMRADNGHDADVLWSEDDTGLHLHLPGQQLAVALQVPGIHNRNNAAAAAAAALALGASPAAIAEGLSSYRGYRGRLQRKAGLRGSIIIDDSYNANPASLIAALQVLAETDQRRERWLAMGDMGELGPQGPELHRNVGEQASVSGVQRLYATGELCREAVAGFGEGARHFNDKQALIDALRSEVHDKVSLLVKGSREARMEQVVNALTADSEQSSSGSDSHQRSAPDRRQDATGSDQFRLAAYAMGRAV